MATTRRVGARSCLAWATRTHFTCSNPVVAAIRRARLGWRAEDLFGVHPATPATRYDAMGLMPLMGGYSSLAVASSSIGGSTVLSAANIHAIARPGVGIVRPAWRSAIWNTIAPVTNSARSPSSPVGIWLALAPFSARNERTKQREPKDGPFLHAPSEARITRHSLASRRAIALFALRWSKAVKLDPSRCLPFYC